MYKPDHITRLKLKTEAFDIRTPFVSITAAIECKRCSITNEQIANSVWPKEIARF